MLNNTSDGLGARACLLSIATPPELITAYLTPNHCQQVSELPPKTEKVEALLQEFDGVTQQFRAKKDQPKAKAKAEPKKSRVGVWDLLAGNRLEI